jgi:transcriptional regulator with XRE-family HTH domain
MNKLNDVVLKRIKDLREFCEFSIEDFAKKINISENEYIDYETGVKDIPIGTFYNIAAALSIDPTVLLTGNMSTNSEAAVVYEGKGMQIERYAGYSFVSLANDFMDRKMEPMIVELKKGIVPELVIHTGQEFNYVLEGELRVIVGTKEYYLRANDSIYFNPSIPHAQVSMTEKAKFLTVILEE